MTEEPAPYDVNQPERPTPPGEAAVARAILGGQGELPLLVCLWAEIVQARPRFEGSTPGYNIIYPDGHVQWIPEGEFLGCCRPLSVAELQLLDPMDPPSYAFYLKTEVVLVEPALMQGQSGYTVYRPDGDSTWVSDETFRQAARGVTRRERMLLQQTVLEAQVAAVTDRTTPSLE